MNNDLSLFEMEDEPSRAEVAVGVQEQAVASDLVHSREQVMHEMTRKLNDQQEEKESPIEVAAAEAQSERSIYQKDEIFPDVVKYFGGDELAAGVWIDKYALKDRNGSIMERTPEDMHRRMAREFARIEKRYVHPMSEDLIFSLFDKFKYVVPQGSPMAGIGNNDQIVSLSNCFVIGNEDNSDSYGGIMKMDEEQVQLMKRRGGVGHDLSDIRPTGSHVQNCALSSTGVVPFMERFSNSTREVAQDGRRRQCLCESGR